jgi:SAM-dependent methyltransferase
MMGKADQSNHILNRQAVIQRELEWHEREADRRISLDKLLYDPPAFDAVVHSGLAFLQPQAGERVLEMGCGEGKEILTLAELGLTVIGVDLSYVQLMRARQLLNDQQPVGQVCLVQANVEQLPFAADTFRILYGKAILHHLDLDLAAAETWRVLRSEGRATFAEPLAHHPLFWLGRRLTPRLHTRDERPFPLSAFQRFAVPFSHHHIEAVFLFAPLAYLIRRIRGGEAIFRRIHAILQRLDNRLFTRVPALRRLAWYGLVKVVKQADVT